MAGLKSYVISFARIQSFMSDRTLLCFKLKVKKVSDSHRASGGCEKSFADTIQGAEIRRLGREACPRLSCEFSKRT